MFGGLTPGQATQVIGEAQLKAIAASFASPAEASTFFATKGFEYLSENQPDTATYRFNLAWLLDPKNAEGYVGLSASYDRLGRFDLSDRVYASLYGITGATAQYYNNVGYSYMLRGNVNAALGNFKKARTLDPENLVVANNIQILQNAAAANKA